MFFSAEVLTSLLLAIPTVEGSVIAERQAAAPINIQFSVPASVFSALKDSNILGNYLKPKTQSGAKSNNNVNTKQLTQGFFIVDQFLSQGPAAAARLGATFLSDPGVLKVSSTNGTNNNPDNVPIFSKCTVEGSPGTDGPDDTAISIAAQAAGSAACAGSALYGNSSGAAAAAAYSNINGVPDPRQQNSAQAYAQSFYPGDDSAASASTNGANINFPQTAPRPSVGAAGSVQGVKDGPHTAIGQRSDDLLMIADCLAGATGATADSTFSTTLVYPINNPSVSRTFTHTAAATCEAGVSGENGGVQFYQGRSSSWVQAAPDYCPSGGVKAVVSCNGKYALQKPPTVVYDIKIDGTITSAPGFVGTLTVKKTSSVAAICK